MIGGLTYVQGTPAKRVETVTFIGDDSKGGECA